MTSGEHFGRLLRAWRTENQLSQTDVAQMLGLDKSREVHLETGKRKAITVEEALQICALLGLSLAEAVAPVAELPVTRMEDDWLAWRVATDMNTALSAVQAVALRMYGHDASTEHAIRCAYVPDGDSRSFATTRGNHTRVIIRELLRGLLVAS